MSGRPSAVMIQTMELIVQSNMVPYAAAQRTEISLGALYRSRLYKLWKDGKHDQLATEMNRERPAPRRAKKPQQFIKVHQGKT